MKMNASHSFEVVVASSEPTRAKGVLLRELLKFKDKRVVVQRTRTWPLRLRATGRFVDILRFSCPAEDDLLRDIVSHLRQQRTDAKESCLSKVYDFLFSGRLHSRSSDLAVWLHAPGSLSIPLEADSAADDLLKECRRTAVSEDDYTSGDYLGLSVAGCYGKAAGGEFAKKVRDGIPPAKAAQQVTQNSNPLEHFQEAKFVV